MILNRDLAASDHMGWILRFSQECGRVGDTPLIWPTILMALMTLSCSDVSAEPPDFERDVAPILINHCLECHHRGKTSGGLNLSSYVGLIRGGETGTAISTEKPESSLIIARINTGEMPPPKPNVHPLSDSEKATLRSWITSSSVWPANRELGLHEQKIQFEGARDFWSYRPIHRPPVPHVTNSGRGTNPIDAFIDEKLVAQRIEPAAPASQRQLLRRAWLDLIGLPSSIEEQDQWISNSNSAAYEELIDRLLENRGYGERWARYWLDLVRYADSNGYERDAEKPSVWRYRDYVIDSLNRDKPYDRFVIEQLAGDELPDRSAETVIATGFHALGAWQDEVDPLEAPQYRADELDDMLRTTSQTLLGVTIGCVRCHNHKFDPVSMVDYYSLSAILSPMKRPNVGREDRDRPAGSIPQLKAIEARDTRIAELNRQNDDLRSNVEKQWLDSGKSQLPAEVLAACRLSPKERNPEQVKLIQNHAQNWRAEIAKAMSEDCRQTMSNNERAIEQLRHETPDLPRAYFQFEETTSPPASFLLLSGRASNPGPQMQPAVPVVLTQTQPSFVPTEHGTSGRRLAFAKWVVDPANPLTARVIVNRVWQHHFGQGLVATPSDFGHIGARPTHPELLDWLADWFVHDAQWSLKKLHRLIMTSRTYRSTSFASEKLRTLDPENKLLGRFPRRRLDVESIRDSVLATSGKLNREMYGPAVFLPIDASVVEAHTDKEASWKVSSEPAIYRRTVYAYVKRTLLVPMLEVLDLCDTTNSTEKRSITCIAPQALTLYNGEFINQQAAFFADRLTDEVGNDSARQIDRAYRLALSRPPTANELAALNQFLNEESNIASSEAKADPDRCALVQMCRVILNLNEFVYTE